MYNLIGYRTRFKPWERFFSRFGGISIWYRANLGHSPRSAPAMRVLCKSSRGGWSRGPPRGPPSSRTGHYRRGDPTTENKLFRIFTKRNGVRFGLYSSDGRGLIRKFKEATSTCNAVLDLTRCLAPATALRLWRLRLSVHNAALFRRCSHLVGSTQPDAEGPCLLSFSVQQNKISALYLRELVVESISHIKSGGSILPSYFQAVHEVTWDENCRRRRASCRPRRRKRMPKNR